MKKNWRDNSKTSVEEDFFGLSISDLMAGLLAVFILTLSYYILNFTQVTAQLTQNEVKRTMILNNIKEEMNKNGFEVKVDTEHGILRLPEGILFDVGQADLKPKGAQVVGKLGEILVEVLNKQEYQTSVETIFIEGHTDDVPILTAQFPSNWELSTKRAINTWLEMQKLTKNIDNIKNNKKQNIFSCSGYAETRPIAENTNLGGRNENRRIDLRFSMSPPTEDDKKIVKNIRKQISE